MTRFERAPLLETPRLHLRAHRAADLDACVALWTDPSVVRHIGGRPFSREEVWARMLRYAGHWPLLGFGFWAVEEKVTGAFIGEIGFATFQREIEPPFGDTPEGGWAFAADSQGKGFATEALGAALSFVETHLGAPRTACLIEEDNAASIRLATRHGYRLKHPTTYKGRANLVFER